MSGVEDFVPAPRTASALKDRISTQWGDVRESLNAVEIFEIGDRSVTCRHMSMTCWGLLPENGVLPVSQRQIFFTEADAIEAMWHHYCLKTPHRDFTTDNVGVTLFWRIYPETSYFHGAGWKAYMRYGVVYKTRTGEFFTPTP